MAWTLCMLKEYRFSQSLSGRVAASGKIIGYSSSRKELDKMSLPSL